MNSIAELRIRRVAKPETVTKVRHLLSAFFSVLDLHEQTVDDVLTAVGEVLANAVEHAYSGMQPGDVALLVRADDHKTLIVDVSDQGTFIERAPRNDRGFGMRIVRAVAKTVEIDTSNGTNVRMTFDIRGTVRPLRGT